MANQLTNKNSFLFKTGGTPAAEDVITTSSNVLVNPEPKSIDYKDIGNGVMGNAKTVVNDDYVTASFNIDVNAKASGAAGTAPKIAELFKASGMKETVVADTSVTYSPATAFVTGNGKAYLDGAMREITGVAGDFTISGEVGDIAKFSFALKGFTTLDETAEDNPAVTLDTNSNLVIKSVVALTVGGDEIDLKSFDFSFGAEIKEIYAANVKEFYIGDYKPTMKVKAIKTKGNASHWTELKNNSKKEVIVTLGGGDGETLELKASYCAPASVSESDSDGKVVYERTWNCEASAGSDNFEITYK